MGRTPKLKSAEVVQVSHEKIVGGHDDVHMIFVLLPIWGVK